MICKGDRYISQVNWCDICCFERDEKENKSTKIITVNFNIP